MSRTYAHTPIQYRKHKINSPSCSCYLCHKEFGIAKSKRKERKGELLEQDFQDLINDLQVSTINLNTLLRGYKSEN